MPTTPPIVGTLPSAPNRNDAPPDFTTKADAFVAALAPMVTQENALATWMNGAAVETANSATSAAGSASAAATSATDAATQVTLAAAQVTLATNQVGLATTQANNAAASANSAQVAAAAAGAAAGLPTLPGNAGKGLAVKTDETGVEWASLGQAIGDTLFTARSPGSTYLKGANTYLQSSYPELFSVLGLLTDGSQLTARALPGSGLTFSSIAYGNGVFVTAVSDPAGSNCYTSTDGINWTIRALGNTGTWFVRFINNQFVILSMSGTLFVKTSSDGITWASVGTVPNAVADITYGAGLYVLLTAAGLVYTSPNLVTWTARTFPLNSGTSWGPLTFAAGVFVAVAGTGQVNTSTDGITWTYRVTLANRAWGGIAYGNGFFVSVGNGYAARSVDGITWEQLPQNSLLAASGITFGAGVFATSKGTPSTSKDGDFWVSRGNAPSSQVAVAYGAGLFVTVGASSTGGATFPFASYDTTTLFYIPSLLRAQQGFTEYVKARLS